MSREAVQRNTRRTQNSKNWLPKTAVALPEASRVAVIGAGIAGATIAAELANSGFLVTVFEREKEAATAASGNIAGNCLPVVDRGNAPYNQWYWQAWRMAYQWWQTQDNPRLYGDLSSAFKWSSNAHKQATWRQWVNELAQPEIVKWHNPLVNASNIQGLWFRQGGYLIPKRVVTRLLDHPRIQLKTQANVVALVRVGDRWQLSVEHADSACFDAVVMATGAKTAHLLPKWQPFLQLNKGQVSHVLASDWHSVPECVLSYGGYATPAIDGVTCVGATFEADAPLGLTQKAHQHNLAMLTQVMPKALRASAEPVGGHSAYRVMTADHLPLVGQALDVEAYQARMRACALHPDTCPDAKDLLLPNLWFSVGHGSRGLTSSFLAAAHLKAAITGQISPASERLTQAVHPARVIFRQMAQNAIR